jgi:multiple sugar transport system substrate-binding protein
MNPLTRRRLLRAGTTAAIGTALAPSLLDAARAWAADLEFQPEAGAELRLLRWARFVVAEEEAFLAALAAFTAATGVSVRVDSEGFEDLRPKAAVAANVGKGPDIVWGIHADAHLYPDAMLDVSDLAEHLGNKYGGWYPIALEYGIRQGKWINLPYTISGNLMNYRTSRFRAVGFDKFPERTDDFLHCMQELKKAGTPGGFALGNASGDGNAWCYWLLWAFGGKVVDKDGNVVLDSPETIAALEYGKELAATFIEGAGAWLDVNNNRAFLAGDISVSNNGISIYAAAQRDGLTELAEDMDHAPYPVGPVGERTEFHVMFPMMAYSYTRYPNAVKALLLWLMEKDQYDAFLQGSVGYLTHTLKAFNENPIWTSDPKRTPFRDIVEHTRSFAWEGSLGYAAAGVFADFVVVNMVAEAASGSKTPAEAAADAQRRAERYYKV